MISDHICVINIYFQLIKMPASRKYKKKMSLQGKNQASATPDQILIMNEKIRYPIKMRFHLDGLDVAFY